MQSKPGAHGRLFLYVVTFDMLFGDGGYPTVYRVWAYSPDHAADKATELALFEGAIAESDRVGDVTLA